MEAIEEGAAVKVAPTVVGAAPAGAIVGDDGWAEGVNVLRDEGRRHVARNGAISPAAGIVEDVGPRQLLVARIVWHLLPRLLRDIEDHIDAVAGGVEVVPRVMWAQPVFPMPFEIPDSHSAVRHGRIQEVEGHEASLAIDKVDGSGFDMILDANLNERGAGVVGNEGDFNGDGVAVGRGDCVCRRRVFGIDTDEATPLRNMDETAGVRAGVESIVRGRVVVMIEFDSLNRDHRGSPASYTPVLYSSAVPARITNALGWLRSLGWKLRRVQPGRGLAKSRGPELTCRQGW